MVTFESEEFLSELKECFKYFENTCKLYIDQLLEDFYDILDENFDPTEYDDNHVGYDTIIRFNSWCENEIELTIRQLLELTNIVKSVQLIDNLKCVSENYFLCRVSTDIEQIAKLNSYFKANKAFAIECTYTNNNKISCSLVSQLTVFGLKIVIEGDYDDDLFPAVLEEDCFVEIRSDNKLTLKDFENIFNSYIFEIDTSYDIRLKMYRRPYMTYEDEIEESNWDICLNEIRLRPLLFGKGMPEVLTLYNSVKGTTNLDMIIIQYTKVLEYISQTVVRQKTTQILKSKLLTSKALNPNADFIRELEATFDELKQKYNTDRNLIKAVIESCCDIEFTSYYVPKYLNKIKQLASKLRKAKSDKEQCIKEVIELLSNSISDTRNYIAHSKANYTLNGHECPEDEKPHFIEMLRIISIQTIRWFSSVNEEDRITNEQI